MPTRLPLYYYRQLVGHALVDDSFAYLGALTWGVDIPPTLKARRSPDVMVATLREDPDVLARCRPFVQTHSLVIRLNRFVMRPEIFDLVNFYIVTHRKETRHALKLILSSIGRIVHVNSSRIDCRVDNLREITTGDDVPIEGVSHA